MRLILSVVKSLINFQFQALLFTVQYNIQKYRIPRKRARFGQRKWAFWTSLFKFVHFVWKFRRSRNNKLHIILNVMTSQLRYACHKHIYKKSNLCSSSRIFLHSAVKMQQNILRKLCLHNRIKCKLVFLMSENLLNQTYRYT